jgi:hypothetical protein
MRKIAQALATLVLIATALSVVTWAAKHRAKKDRDFGSVVNTVVETLSDFPDLFTQAVHETATLPPTFVKTPKNFTPINTLELDVKALMTYSMARQHRGIDLLNLRNQDTLHHWDVKGGFEANSRIMHPLLLSEKRIVYSMNGLPHIRCIDSAGVVLWKNEQFEHHHAFNLDHLGQIWACTYDRQEGQFLKYDGHFKLNGKRFDFVDNEVTCFDPTTGDALYSKSMAQMFAEAGLQHLVFRSDKADDPYHLNDVEPALFSGPHFEAGDLFLSFRSLSAVVQFRPSEDRIIRVITGPFYAPHDVDILDANTLALFNNHSHIKSASNKKDWPLVTDSSRIDLGNFHSGITLYDFGTSSFSSVWPEVFTDQNLFTYTEGLSERLPDGSWFVEEQNEGVLWVIDSTGVRYRDVLTSQHPGHHHLSNWTRILH